MVLAAPTSACRIARFNIDDNGRFQIDEIIVGVGEERMSLSAPALRDQSKR
jgi:hypothetical protein